MSYFCPQETPETVRVGDGVNPPGESLRRLHPSRTSAPRGEERERATVCETVTTEGIGVREAGRTITTASSVYVPEERASRTGAPRGGERERTTVCETVTTEGVGVGDAGRPTTSLVSFPGERARRSASVGQEASCSMRGGERATVCETVTTDGVGVREAGRPTASLVSFPGERAIRTSAPCGGERKRATVCETVTAEGVGVGQAGHATASSVFFPGERARRWECSPPVGLEASSSVPGGERMTVCDTVTAEGVGVREAGRTIASSVSFPAERARPWEYSRTVGLEASSGSVSFPEERVRRWECSPPVSLETSSSCSISFPEERARRWEYSPPVGLEASCLVSFPEERARRWECSPPVGLEASSCSTSLPAERARRYECSLPVGQEASCSVYFPEERPQRWPVGLEGQKLLRRIELIQPKGRQHEASGAPPTPQRVLRRP